MVDLAVLARKVAAIRDAVALRTLSRINTACWTSRDFIMSRIMTLVTY